MSYMNQHFCLHNLVVNSRIGNPYTGQCKLPTNLLKSIKLILALISNHLTRKKDNGRPRCKSWSWLGTYTKLRRGQTD